MPYEILEVVVVFKKSYRSPEGNPEDSEDEFEK